MIYKDSKAIEDELFNFHRNGASFADASDLLESIYQYAGGNIRRALDLLDYEKQGRAYVIPFDQKTPIWSVQWNTDREPMDDDYWELSPPQPFSLDMLGADGKLKPGYYSSKSEAEAERMQRYITTIQSHSK